MSQDIHFPGRDLNWITLEYKSRVLPLSLTYTDSHVDGKVAAQFLFKYLI